MQDFKEQPRAISLFPPTCLTGNGIFMPDIVPAEAVYVKRLCTNPHDYNIITCESTNRQEFIDEVGGIKLDISLPPLGIKHMPSYIPSLSIKAATMLAATGQYSYFGTTLKDIMISLTRWVSGGFREAGQIKFRPTLDFKAFANVPKLILFLTGTDTGIEYLWRERDGCNLFNILQEMNFAAVSGFNFSLFEGECAFAQALNQKRSLYSSHLLDQYGIRPIPHIYTLTPYQIRRWMLWLLSNPDVQYFTINCQLEKTDEYINKNVKVIRYMLENLPYLHVILQGFPFDSIHKFGPIIDNIHFVDAVPINQTINHMKIDINQSLTKTITNVKMDFLPLLMYNINTREMQLSNIRKQIFEQQFRRTA